MKNNICYAKLLEKFDKFDEAIHELKMKINNLMELCDNEDPCPQGQTNDTQTDPQQENNNE